MTDRPLNVAVIGCGFIGKVHASAYLNVPLHYDPVPVRTRLFAVCTAHQETARRAKERFGFELATTDWREAIAHPDVDLVSICTPNAAHQEQLLCAIEHGKHIYCDKPLAASADQARRVIGALDGYSGTHQMVFHLRFFPATIKARELVDAGFLGQVLTFRAAYLHAGSVDPQAPFRWRFSKGAAGGGALYDLGSHVIDILCHLVGDFAELTASTHIAFTDRPSPDDPSIRVPVDADDAAFLLVRTASGALGSIEATRLATGAQDELRFEIHGTAGALRFNLMDPNWLDVYDRSQVDPGWRRLPTALSYPGSGGFLPAKASIGWARAHVACLHNFLCAVARGGAAQPGLEVGADVQEIMDAAYRSAEGRRWVAL